MKKEPYKMTSIAEVHRILEVPGPEHPLLSVVDLDAIKCYAIEDLRSVVYSFYCVSIKKNFKGKMKYGQRYYDFDDGVMTFFSPGQVVSADIDENLKLEGWWLLIHPDFLKSYPLAKTIREYGFFSYAVHEALHLSPKEEDTVTAIIRNIQQEYHSPIDTYSQNVIIAQISLLLNYCDRFYNRQFITRKNANNDLLVQLEELLSSYFNGDQVRQRGLPTVQYLSEQLHVSPDYLSDMLRSVTGMNTQQHIHHQLIEKAKEILTTTSLSVSEIAYSLGFEYPQSFNKLFKNKTSLSPLAFRNSFN
ncbi:helix-turn-helix domain-containing protein [Chitinophaga sp. SYP-B3965]|uniref:helix-turn-helix domain-containing protein n=1 Tax=Chitinophaga sp. SYP-B3965 TaxID=2663120 RepID=UPI0012997340|nr:helix-turn-helix transcriptional regulator [Chitinophaga sp. SYP-B3965]MRG45045.1 helix-turn-helix domain-containing protein [Chitinophaga sp. SYP-B3965]